ncbi:MAG: hypothetical protein AAFS03_02140, partial [Pseudomonadota bacterium]
MLQVRNRAPDRHEHSVLLESNPEVVRQHWITPGEALPFSLAISICTGALAYLHLPFEPPLYLVFPGFCAIAVILIAAYRVGIP